MKNVVCICVALWCTKVSFSQTTVTAVYSDFNGFWSSSTNAINSVKPNDSHNLLAFKVGTTIYSTGVNDNILTAQGIAFVPQEFESLPISNMGSGGIIGVGYNYGGAGDISPVPVANNPIYYLLDGIKGMDLGTGVFNAKGTNMYSVVSIEPSAIGDGIPDLIIPQIGDPGGLDQFYFIDGSGVVIGNSVNVNMSNVPPVGTANWKFYTLTTPPVFGAAAAGNRSLRMVAYDFADLGINLSNYQFISHFVHKLSGNSDQSFVAYNKTSVIILPVQLSYFAVHKQGQAAALQWETSSELNNEYFVVQHSTDGENFTDLEVIKSQSLHGNSNSLLHYSYLHARPNLGDNYYRLKQVDFNGATTYSDLRSVRFDQVGIAIYPNPTVDVLYIDGAKPNSFLKVFNLQGQLIMEVEASVGNNGELHVDHLLSGIYVVQVTSHQEEVFFCRFVKK